MAETQRDFHMAPELVTFDPSEVPARCMVCEQRPPTLWTIGEHPNAKPLFLCQPCWDERPLLPAEVEAMFVEV